MIGTLPMCQLAPLEYRYALDAAATLLPAASVLCCNVPALEAEVRQRITDFRAAGAVTGALWVEPLHTTWRADLRRLTRSLAANGTLVIVASQPLARLVPERQRWNVQPLGLDPRGMLALRRSLGALGYRVEAVHGLHSALSIAINMISTQCERWQRPDLADRWHFAARLRYRAAGWHSILATVALIVARKERST